MTGAITVRLTELAGVPSDSLYMPALAWGSALLVGSLVYDDIRSGRRRVGEGLRSSTMEPPVVLGSLAVVVFLTWALAVNPETFGWWATGAGVGILGVAWLARLGALSGIAYVLMAVGATELSPWSLRDDPWLFVWLATPLVVVSWAAERWQGSAPQPWHRWDIPPLVVAHLIGVFALVSAAFEGGLSRTALAFGLLSMAIGLWRRRRLWAEIGNLMVIIAAADLGLGWLALALGVTSLRGIVSLRWAAESARLTYQAIAVVSAGLAWPAFLLWREATGVQSANLSIVVFGALGLLIATLNRWRGLRSDTTWSWGSFASFGTLTTAALTLVEGGPGVDGPWFAVGLLLTAVSFDVVWPLVGRGSRFVAPFGVAASWVALVYGMRWDDIVAAGLTGVVFGAVMLAVPEIMRARRGDADMLDLARLWAGMGAVGVVVATMLAYDTASLDQNGFWIAGALTLFAVASARGARPLRIGLLRDLALLAGFGSVLTLGYTLGLDDVVIASGVLVIAAASTLFSLAIWNRASESNWVRPTIVLALAANVLAGVLALSQWPDRLLLIGVLLSAGVQVVAIGLIRRLPGVLAIGPPLLGLAWVLSLAESVGGSAQWYTVPIGLVILAEVEILRTLPRFSDPDRDRGLVLLLEWIGLAVLLAPALVEMFTTSLFLGLIGLGLASAVFIWGIATRVQRRVIAAAAMVIVTLVLMLFAAAANSFPEDGYFWIVATGVGSAVALVGGLLEAYRKKSGKTMARIDELMAGWD